MAEGPTSPRYGRFFLEAGGAARRLIRYLASTSSLFSLPLPAFAPGERWYGLLMILVIYFFPLQALLDLSINRQVFRLPWENQAQARCRSVAEACRATRGQDAWGFELMAFLLSSAGFMFLSPRRSYCLMPVRGEQQNKKDIAIFTMASLPFRTSTGRVLRPMTV